MISISFSHDRHSHSARKKEPGAVGGAAAAEATSTTIVPHPHTLHTIHFRASFFVRSTARPLQIPAGAADYITIRRRVDDDDDDDSVAFFLSRSSSMAPRHCNQCGRCHVVLLLFILSSLGPQEFCLSVFLSVWPSVRPSLPSSLQQLLLLLLLLPVSQSSEGERSSRSLPNCRGSHGLRSVCAVGPLTGVRGRRRGRTRIRSLNRVRCARS